MTWMTSARADNARLAWRARSYRSREDVHLHAPIIGSEISTAFEGRTLEACSLGTAMADSNPNGGQAWDSSSGPWLSLEPRPSEPPAGVRFNLRSRSRSHLFLSLSQA